MTIANRVLDLEQQCLDFKKLDGKSSRRNKSVFKKINFSFIIKVNLDNGYFIGIINLNVILFPFDVTANFPS